ncbi:uncharacterized protein LOC119685291 [Teleopsis dalmanni]|uniref:uncharacterized protein LOC119685291 n=1 Tax=Teleopsis dalmanni TaxID=139649 RepID=UPI0018CE5684|nr:uncharacterized protein LOC119685291 [Teleopsis dalmanni]XP_037955461.1 uncharacterized protein LOC119685291 [Teleopsis dalmanni]
MKKNNYENRISGILSNGNRNRLSFLLKETIFMAVPSEFTTQSEMSEFPPVKESETEDKIAAHSSTDGKSGHYCDMLLSPIENMCNFVPSEDDQCLVSSELITNDKDSIREVEYPILTLKKKENSEYKSESGSPIKSDVPKFKTINELTSKKNGNCMINTQNEGCPQEMESTDKSLKTITDDDKYSDQCIEYPILRLKRRPKTDYTLTREAFSKSALLESNIESITEVEAQFTQNDQQPDNSRSLAGATVYLGIEAVEHVNKVDYNEALSVFQLEKQTLSTDSESEYCSAEQPISQLDTKINEFCLQKSNSLVDLKTLRLLNCKTPITLKKGNITSRCAGTIKDSTGSCSALDVLQQLPTKYFFQHGLLSSNRNSESDIKFYSLLMLNTWRKQRLEVERMKQETEEAKQNCNNTRNQIYVLNNLYRIEMKCNTDMQVHLGFVLESIRENKCIAKSLTEQCDLRLVKKSILQKNLQSKNVECQGLNEILTEMRNKLFGCNHSTEKLRMLIDEEQAKGVMLRSQLDDLVVDIDDLKTKNKEKLTKIENVITITEIAISEKKLKIDAVKATSELLQAAHEDFGDYEAAIAQWRLQVQELREKVVVLQNEIENNRLMNWVKNSLVNILDPETKVGQAIHIILYLLLPAVPPPRSIQLPYEFSMGKSMSFVTYK